MSAGSTKMKATRNVYSGPLEEILIEILVTKSFIFLMNISELFPTFYRLKWSSAKASKPVLENALSSAFLFHPHLIYSDRRVGHNLRGSSLPGTMGGSLTSPLLPLII
ncbi:unnamed protein product [Lepeophtheirus salmonis]|uniref:(salmon louse) hypothetical protein n=1 Tax=Lepeophtheirus salmonis TaxID=72036 RepID=A0A7R8CUR0_LEPSM|nr:unnamed protein product [Lepeophtheirus salmonis]CAF2938470.1 unnamed protein product [Lepeophtheirus salmonis]